MDDAELERLLAMVLAERETPSAPLIPDIGAVLKAIRSETPFLICWRRDADPIAELGPPIAEFGSVLVFKRTLDSTTLLGLLRQAALEGLCPDDTLGWRPFPGNTGEPHEKV